MFASFEIFLPSSFLVTAALTQLISTIFCFWANLPSPFSIRASLIDGPLHRPLFFVLLPAGPATKVSSPPQQDQHLVKRQLVTCPGYAGYCTESYPGDTCLVVCAFGRNNVPECQVNRSVANAKPSEPANHMHTNEQSMQRKDH